MNEQEKKEYGKKWREEHKDKMKKYSEAYYEKNSDELKRKARDRYYKTREARKSHVREYARKNQDKIKILRYKYWREVRVTKERELWTTPLGRAKRIISTSRNMAKHRGLSHSLTINDILPAIEAGYCQVTKIPFIFDDAKSPWKPTIDRIDSSKGYEIGNVQIVVWMYNLAKYNYSLDDVLFMAHALIDHQESAS